MTFPHPEPVQAQQGTLPEVSVPKLNLEVIITPEPTVEAEPPTALHATTALSEHPEVTFPVQPIQVQQQTFYDVTVPLLDLELTITPEPSLEAEYSTSLQSTTTLLKNAGSDISTSGVCLGSASNLSWSDSSTFGYVTHHNTRSFLWRLNIL
ncbi:hypothetical protein HJG60_010293 [Phyllostomus discolor]|uniref:Leucine-rich repeat-containing protein 37 N-terminal domain-containing protein n=1 Tax=Phyllostomus discolor TaxID=89673 RepID=A0A834EK75_9CHIR|nr:hypothetical protein HJG60_010293 [Phyllostomus discolor]